MNGSGHYALAAQLLAEAKDADPDAERADVMLLLKFAEIHMGLAQAAATALGAVLPLVGGDSDEVTGWARMIGALDDNARQDDVVEAEIYPACWPPIAGDAWTLKNGDAWGLHPVWFAQETPDGMRMIPARIGTDTDDALTPEQLLKQGELELLHRNPWEAPF